MKHKILLLLVFVTITSVCSLQPQLVVNGDGSYKILVGGKVWLESAPTRLHSNGQWQDLRLTNSYKEKGIDFWGPFSEYVLEWNNGAFLTSLRSYSDTPIVSFEQIFPQGAQDTSVGNPNELISNFPSFNLPDPSSDPLGYMTYVGNMLGEGVYGIFDSMNTIPGGLDSGPLVLFNQDLSISSVLSASTQFMAGSIAQVDFAPMKAAAAFGIMGNVTHVPKGFRIESILYVGSGINDLIFNWGRSLLKRFNKDPSGPSFDYSLKYLGYYTDNGAYYYYHTENQLNYEQTLFNVKEYADSLSIPYKYIQLDSWWYYKGLADGVKNWTMMPNIMPNGLLNFYQKTGWPIVGHNRYWSSNTDYASANGGRFPFIIESPLAIPTDKAFWDYLLQTSKLWGLIVYEQDWLYNEFIGLKSTQENITLARDWLLNMGQAAADAGLTIQYCMPYPRHVLQSVELPAVTNFRASDDYHPDNAQWKIGVSSIVAYALGLAPSKDNFWTTPVQPGNPYNLKEDYPELESAVATYSTGPVAPSDRIGYSNVELIMRSCNKDGLILKPSKPMTSIDATFLRRAFNLVGPSGEVLTTYTEISNVRWYHIMSVDLTSPYVISPSDLDLSDEFSYVAYKHSFTNSTTVSPFTKTEPIKLPISGKADFGLYHVVPVFENGWAILGELNKWVPISTQRISAFWESTSVVGVSIKGSPNEVVSFTFLNPKSQLVMVNVVISSSGTAVVVPNSQ
eukprot:TRINITY_DN2821_c0_g1_i1.p1 TRINITY_DN2821_c0_g1~~TRINITY_DN2821_c0_g1_i1.p1  ORF type:complete len:734 (+),score=155.15 TRINITY_DN2821_c0_g1_i1:26-2227(+)